MPGLATLSPHRRLTRARYPNCDPEMMAGCYAGGDAMLSWRQDMRCVGLAKTVYEDLRDCDTAGLLPNGAPCYNYSAMWDTYNTYSNGHGGCCSVWEGDRSPYGKMGSYFCGNSSAGGWVGYQDPRGDNTEQGWFVNMFEIGSHDPSAHTIDFALQNGHVKGGWQGGRGWQVGNVSNINVTDKDYIARGSRWYIDNTLAALDAPTEWYFDSLNNLLFLWPNSTDQPPPASLQLVAGQLKTLISVNVSNSSSSSSFSATPAQGIRLVGLGFRDAADISMEPWGVPSGGDWGLHRGGAVFFEGCEGCSVQRCNFQRLDGNAVFLSGYTRNASVTDSEFAWTGHSAVAAWGYTEEQDGTAGQQPHDTYVARNYVRELGVIQIQSSMWFQAKSALTTLEGNVIFNGPRAGINLNDGFGGGNQIRDNLIFNQCRQSGDHGPINSWDRQPFMTTIATGKPSYAPKPSQVSHNFIIANYGASQGFDTDDGSSFYDIHHNFMFNSDGWKMDYGGHDSSFTDNVVVAAGPGLDGQNCFNAWPFLPGHGATWARNKCILQVSKQVGEASGGCSCPGTSGSASASASSSSSSGDPQNVCGLQLFDNAYYANNTGSLYDKNVSVGCQGGVDFTTQWQDRYHSDQGSQLFEYPSDDVLFDWARQVLNLPLPPGPRPPAPGPLPPVPTPIFPDTCQGYCAKNGYCCTGLVSGCNQPSCAQGCLIANATDSLAQCQAACEAMPGHCDYTVGNLTLQECESCPPSCSSCESASACKLGCQYVLNNTHIESDADASDAAAADASMMLEPRAAGDGEVALEL